MRSVSRHPSPRTCVGRARLCVRMRRGRCTDLWPRRRRAAARSRVSVNIAGAGDFAAHRHQHAAEHGRRRDRRRRQCAGRGGRWCFAHRRHGAVARCRRQAVENAGHDHDRELRRPHPAAGRRHRRDRRPARSMSTASRRACRSMSKTAVRRSGWLRRPGRRMCSCASAPAALSLKETSTSRRSCAKWSRPAWSKA